MCIKAAQVMWHHLEAKGCPRGAELHVSIGSYVPCRLMAMCQRLTTGEFEVASGAKTLESGRDSSCRALRIQLRKRSAEAILHLCWLAA